MELLHFLFAWPFMESNLSMGSLFCVSDLKCVRKQVDFTSLSVTGVNIWPSWQVLTVHQYLTLQGQQECGTMQELIAIYETLKKVKKEKYDEI